MYNFYDFWFFDIRKDTGNSFPSVFFFEFFKNYLPFERGTVVSKTILISFHIRTLSIKYGWFYPRGSREDVKAYRQTCTTDNFLSETLIWTEGSHSCKCCCHLNLHHVVLFHFKIKTIGYHFLLLFFLACMRCVLWFQMFLLINYSIVKMLRMSIYLLYVVE